MRIGFTIIYNGAHHLEHNDWGNRLKSMLDLWVIVEGKALNTGSTSWCNLFPDIEDDNTNKLLERLAPGNDYCIHVECANRNKDEMMNLAWDVADEFTYYNQLRFVWMFDIDEQWTSDQMTEAERMLIDVDADCGCFHANHYVGKDLIAKGTWGEGNDPEDPLRNAYRRLWRWKGQRFATHEPPVLEGGNGKEILLPQRFNHYSYYFEKDVIFKSKYYNGYENLHTKWLDLQKETVFPQPISRLLDGHWGTTSTVIDKSVSK